MAFDPAFVQVRQNAKLTVTTAAFASAGIDWVEVVTVSATKQISVYSSQTASHVIFSSPAEGEVPAPHHVFPRRHPASTA